MNHLKTPCLLLDVDRVRRNADRVDNIAHRNSVRLRPHAKTHKCAEVARIQTKGHEGALTVSTLAEARGLMAHGYSDFTYAVPIEPGKFSEAAEIVRGGAKLSLITDDAETAGKLNEFGRQAVIKFDIFLKVDCGYHRCGVAPETSDATEIPRQISNAKHVNLAGILTHAGHSYHAASKEEILKIARHERDCMVELAEKLRAESIEVPAVSIGSTPTITHIDHLEGIDEIRPGNYIFFDAFQATLGSCSFEDCALTVLASVVHRDRARKKIIVDAGAIALSKDRGAVDIDAACGYGRVLDLESEDIGARIDSVSQEHGTFHVSDDEKFDKFKVGTRVRILANHSCLTAAQHSHYNVVENGEIVDRWEILRGW
ncbi:MAG: alanine racemase [Acidobacteria bacterium]|nr:alanine racemase [Acidobacteriota bacterium]